MGSSAPIVKIAAVQECPVFLDRDATVEKACRLIGEAAAGGARLVVFPEAFVPAYPDWVWVVAAGNKALLNDLYTRLWRQSVTLGDEATDRLCRAAAESGVYVVIGVNEKNTASSGASLYNSLFYIDPDDGVVGVHRKLVATGGERLIWAGGDGSTLETFDTPFGRLGGLICWENYMPLPRYHMYRQGVRIYVAATWDSSEVWLASMRHIAKEGGMFVIGCCMALRITDIPDDFDFKSLYPADKEWINPGRSCVVSPTGQLLAGPLEAEQGILYADLDMDQVPAIKWILDSAGHYDRPDVFELIVRE